MDRPCMAAGPSRSIMQRACWVVELAVSRFEIRSGPSSSHLTQPWLKDTSCGITPSASSGLQHWLTTSWTVPSTPTYTPAPGPQTCCERPRRTAASAQLPRPKNPPKNHPPRRHRLHQPARPRPRGAFPLLTRHFFFVTPSTYCTSPPRVSQPPREINLASPRLQSELTPDQKESQEK